MDAPAITTNENNVSAVNNEVEANLLPSFSIPAQEDAQGWKNLYRQLGQPEHPDNYVFPELKEGNVDEKLQHWFKEHAFEAGLSNTQVTKLASAWQHYIEQDVKDLSALHQQQSQEALYQLEQEWGPAFNDKIDIAKRAVTHYGFTHHELDALETALGTKPMLSLCAKLGEALKEPGFVGGTKTAVSDTPQLAKQALQELTQDKVFMSDYLNGKKEAVQKITQLMKQMHN